MVGAFPGFVWGWFQVPDYSRITGIEQLIAIYKLPILGLLLTGVRCLILKNIVRENVLIN
jgi:hypothetical protein